MRALGLLVDGPQVWGKPAAARAPGVFVVELNAPPAAAPIDIVAVRRWVERVPALRLDGERPTPQELAARLAEFWLPEEPILFVGRSPRSVGQRLAAIYATPLGDARPTGMAHWLKSLSVLGSLRVWWSDTDAHEEYEDALLTQVAARNNVGRTPPVLPFANLALPDGTRRAHGITSSLLTDSPAPTPGSTAAKRKPTRSPTRTTASRTVTGVRSPRATVAPPRPMPEATQLSREGLARIEAELEDLRTNARPEVIARVKAARELGDLKENADYEYARKEQSFLEGRIQALEQLVRTAVVIEQPAQSDAVHMGSTVDVESDGERETFVIVGSNEANPSLGRLSNVSPVGRALMGARAGDEVRAELPGGTAVYRVIEVRQTN
jgi:transcription elongation factor GreA